jgi:hypothetical protein
MHNVDTNFIGRENADKIQASWWELRHLFQ